MGSKRELEQLTSERWPQLKKKAQNETDPDKLIAIVEEIDDLLFLLEMRVLTRTLDISSKAKTESGSEC